MSRQPLLMWRKATALRAPNAIEDLDEFDRNMACSMGDRTVTPTGVILLWNRYSCRNMGDVASEFERGNRLPAKDITPKQRRRNSDPHRALARNCKIKYDPDDLGHLFLWIPYGANPRWEKLLCTNPDMQNVPVWLQQKIMQNQNIEADQFCSRERQSVLRATLFNSVANTTEKATAKQRRVLGRALNDKNVAALLARHVEVSSESAKEKPNSNLPPVPMPEPNYSFENSRLAGVSRKDSLETTPRPTRKSSRKPRTWAQVQREKKQRTSQQRTHSNAATVNTKSASDGKKRRSSGIPLTWKEAS